MYGFPCIFTLHIMKSKCPIVKFYKPFLVHVTNMSYLDILSVTACFVRGHGVMAAICLNAK